MTYFTPNELQINHNIILAIKQFAREYNRKRTQEKTKGSKEIEDFEECRWQN